MFVCWFFSVKTVFIKQQSRLLYFTSYLPQNVFSLHSLAPQEDIVTKILAVKRKVLWKWFELSYPDIPTGLCPVHFPCTTAPEHRTSWFLVNKLTNWLCSILFGCVPGQIPSQLIHKTSFFVECQSNDNLLWAVRAGQEVINHKKHHIVLLVDRINHCGDSTSNFSLLQKLTVIMSRGRPGFNRPEDIRGKEYANKERLITGVESKGNPLSQESFYKLSGAPWTPHIDPIMLARKTLFQVHKESRNYFLQ